MNKRMKEKKGRWVER